MTVARVPRSFWVFTAGLLVVALALGFFQGIKSRNGLANLWQIPTSEVTIYKTDYWMGELVEAVVERGEYRACYPDYRSAQPATVGLCFSAHRMPVVTYVMAAVASVYNDVVFLTVVKALLIVGLYCVAIWMVASQARDWRPIGFALALLYVADPANTIIWLNSVSEESILAPLMALTGAILFAAGTTPAEMSTRKLLCLAVIVALMPMTKSSSLLPALVIAGLVGLFVRRDRLAPLLPAVLLAAALIAWGTFTYRATGHFAWGSTLSSLNGYNLHHGYTPYYGEVAPRYHLDLPVSRGQIKLTAPVHDEWEFNKQFTDRSIAFIRNNPGTAAWYLVIKAYAALFKLTPEYQPYNGQDGFFLPKHLILTAGLTPDRLVLWLGFAAAVAACRRGFRRGGWRGYFTSGDTFSGVALLAVTSASVLPFIIAFSTFRHIVPVYYFVAPYLALFALRSPVLSGSWALRMRGLTGEPAKA